MKPNQKTPVKVDIAVQNPTSFTPVPSNQQFERWVNAVLHGSGDQELLIRIVDRRESRQLNARYRHKNKATNVLSFPAELPEEVGLPLLGDIIICAPIVAEEARDQNKSAEAHWAHLTIHGILHLLGHDHQAEEEACAMESLETRILQSLGFPDPYSDPGSGIL
jgi:probable rRNA maturation factor